MLAQHELLGNTRYLMQTSMGSLPHQAVMRSIELLGEVAVAVRCLVARVVPGRLTGPSERRARCEPPKIHCPS